MIDIFLFAIGILMGSGGAIVLKKGAEQLSTPEVSLNFLISFISNPFIILGFILYFLPALIWIFLMTKYPVSFVQPILALTYVITPILAMLILKETVPNIRWVGVLVIVIGVFIVSRTS